MTAIVVVVAAMLAAPISSAPAFGARRQDPPSPPTGGFPDSGAECQPASAQPNWPTFHVVNNVTKHADGHLSMENLNDANAVRSTICACRPSAALRGGITLMGHEGV